MNYQDMQTQFLGLLNRRDCTTTQAQTFIQLAIQRIQRELRLPCMEKVLLVTITSPYAGLVIPSDMIELIDIIPISCNGGTAQTNQQRLEKCDVSRANLLAMNTGIPEQYYRDGGLWTLGPAPLIGDVIKVKYYAELGALVNGTDTNTLSLIAWDLIVYGALIQAGINWTDKRMAGWENQYETIAGDLKGQADDDEESGAAAVQPAFAYPDDIGDCDYPYPTPGGF